MLTRMDVLEWIATWEQLGGDTPGGGDPLSPVTALIASSSANASLAGVSIRPYSALYARLLGKAATSLRAAAQSVSGVSKELRTFLHARAVNFETNAYAESERAWLDVPWGDEEFILVIGPYSKYGDKLMATKRTFKAVLAQPNPVLSRAFSSLASILQACQDASPMPEYAPRRILGSNSRVVIADVLRQAGSAGAGPQPTACNLPSPGIIKGKHGSIRLLLSNVLRAKYVHILKPASHIVFQPRDRELLSFDAFLMCVCFHEIFHGLGAKTVSHPDSPFVGSLINIAMGKNHSPLEEAKANIGGLWLLLSLLRKSFVDSPDLVSPEELADVISRVSPDQVAITFVGSLFRSMRFGLHEAHGRSAALQFRYLKSVGGIVLLPPAGLPPTGDSSSQHGRDDDGDSSDNGEDEAHADISSRRYRVDLDALHTGAHDLLGIILDVQASGNPARASELLDQYASSVSLNVAMALASMSAIPTDVRPDYSHLRHSLAAIAANDAASRSLVDDEVDTEADDSDEDSDDGEDHPDLDSNSDDD